MSVSRRRIAGAGLLGAAAAIATTAPQAHATAATAPGTGHTLAGLDSESAAASRVVPAGVTPTFGFQKVRVGVQIPSGAYVPPGTTTVGTVITVEETGPATPISSEGGDCTTQASTVQPGSTESDCVYSQFSGQGVSDYTASPGDTVTVTQKTVEPGVAIDEQSIVIPPCTTTGAIVCDTTATAILTDPGIPPTAVNDVGRVREGHSLVVNVLSNDDTAGAPLTLTVNSAPGHGSASVVSPSSATPTIRYQPKLGFHGTDTFTYAVRTANGTATAKVTIAVIRAGQPQHLRRPTAHKDHARTSEDQRTRIYVLRNDQPNHSGKLRIIKVSHPKHGTVIRHKHSVVYIPDPGFYGHDRFTYKVRNQGGVDTTSVKVVVTDHDGDFDGD